MFALTNVTRKRRSWSMQAPQPLIYLDLGVMGQIADQSAHADAFVESLRRGGTLCLSLAHAMELANQGPGASMSRVRLLLHRVGPRFCFVSTDPDSVDFVARQHAAPPAAAWFDGNVAEEFAQFAAPRVGTVPASRFVDWALLMQHDAREWTAAAKRGLRDRIEWAGAYYRAVSRPPLVLPTDPIARQALSHLMTDVLTSGGVFKDNDGFDMFHTAVPLVVCDFVVLDGGWKHRAVRVPSPPRRAQVFSGKQGQIEAFLAALEAWPATPEVK